MPLKIVRNDITKMNTEAIVNTANTLPVVGPGCDMAIYKAAGYDELLAYRTEHIGEVPEGDAFITPGFRLRARYIIHAVSPLFVNGSEGEESLLRSCYRKSLKLAKEKGIRSIAFPLISTGGFGYPKEEGLRIAVDEINAFLLKNRMIIYLVVFDEKASNLGRRLFPDLEEYIDQNYVAEVHEEEYGYFRRAPERSRESRKNLSKACESETYPTASRPQIKKESYIRNTFKASFRDEDSCLEASVDEDSNYDDSILKLESELEEKMQHISDTFSQYLLYLIKEKNMENAEVYKRALVDKKTFSKIKNNVDYHPQKLTALCLCVGAHLNLDETKDLLARAGYALSPSDKTDIIFSYFIENEIYDMIELDIQLGAHGLPCVIP